MPREVGQRARQHKRLALQAVVRPPRELVNADRLRLCLAVGRAPPGAPSGKLQVLLAGAKLCARVLSRTENASSDSGRSLVGASVRLSARASERLGAHGGRG